MCGDFCSYATPASFFLAYVKQNQIQNAMQSIKAPVILVLPTLPLPEAAASVPQLYAWP